MNRGKSFPGLLRLAGAMLLLTCLSTGAKEHSQPIQDETTAIALAEKKLIPIYGKKQIQSERPFRAKLEGHVWHVWGYLPPDSVGGVAEIWINESDGRTLKTRHGK